MRSDGGLKTNWESWVTHAIGGLEAGQKNLHHRINSTRQDAFRDTWLVRQELHGRLARTERRLTRDKWKWMRHIPWVKIAALCILATLVVTGHVSGADLKAWALRKITDF